MRVLPDVTLHRAGIGDGLQEGVTYNPLGPIKARHVNGVIDNLMQCYLIFQF